MAIILNCVHCGKDFMTSACHGSIFCDDCNGVNAAKQQELDRWQALSLEEKVDELKFKVDFLEKKHE